MFDRLVARLRALLARGRARRELDEELRFHVEMETQANLARGMAPAEARRAALRDLGGVEQTRESALDVRGIWVDSVLQDLRYAARRIRREPGLAAAVVLTVALAVGLSTTVYSLARGILLRPLPYAGPNELVQIWKTLPDWPRASVSVPEYFEWQRECRSFTDLAAADGGGLLLTESGRTEWADALAVTPNLFPMLGVRPILGRDFSSEEGRLGHDRVAVLDEGFWRTAFGSDPRVIGKRIVLSGGRRLTNGPESFEIIGVVPSSARLRYRYPSRRDLYVPLRTFGIDFEYPARGEAALWVFGRLRPGVTASQAGAEVRTVFERRSRSFIEMVPGASVRVDGLHDELLGQTRPLFLLGAIGGCVGIVLAFWAAPVAVRLAPPTLPRLGDVRLDAACVMVGVALTGLLGLASGLVPAGLLSRRDRVGSLSLGQVSRAPGGRLRSVLVVGEAAMVVVLLAASVLIAQGYWRLSRVDTGFDPPHVLSVRLVMPPGTDAGRIGALSRALVSKIDSIAGVAGAAMTSELPFTESGLAAVALEDGRRESGTAVSAVSANFLRVLHVPLLAGRMLSADDELNPRVAVVSERFARQVFPKGNALGRRIGSGQWFEIVGIVGDVTEIGTLNSGVRLKGLGRLTLPRVYVPSAGEKGWYRYLVVRTVGEPSALARAIRDQVASIAPGVAVAETTTLDELVAAAGADTRFTVAVLCSFAAVAFTLACVGLFGIVGYSVTRRRREFGVRLALGSSPAGVRRLVLRQALAPLSAGCAIGLTAALAGGHLIRSFLFEVSPTDTWTHAGAVVLLLAGGAAAAYLPARRASRLDPMSVLRSE